MAQKICPVMSGPVVIPDDRTGRAHPHYVMCAGVGCAMWIGADWTGRCGMMRVTDAEAMKLHLEGNKQ